MANFDYPMSLENPYTFVDPFQVSIDFSVRNLRRHNETTIDDIPLPPFSQQYVSYIPSFVPPRRQSSSSYYSSALSRISSKQSRSPPPASSSSRNTFGIEVTSSRKDRRSRPRMPSPKLRGSRSSFLLTRSDREALPDSSASQNSNLHQDVSGSTHPDIEQPPISGSGSDRSRASHRRKNLPIIDRKSREEARSSREPEIFLEPRHSVARFSSNAISFYKPPTRSSEVVLPSSSPYLGGYFPRQVRDPTKHEHPTIPSAPQPPLAHPHPQSPSLVACIFAFLLDTLPRQVYLNLMLRLPQLYFSHVIRIFEDAEMSMPEIKKMALGANNYLKDPTTSKILESGFASPRYDNLTRSWRAFIDSLMREWKTMNIISVLLLSAILTILQIPSAALDPVTRYSALLSLICALMSLLYGCIYIIHFGMMRSTCRAAEWAHEAQKTTTSIFWNVWVFLAMPATWLAWSIFFFVISIMAFVWRTGTIEDANQTPIISHDALAPRIIVTCLFSLGLVYLIFIRITFQKYGSAMDRAWRSRVLAWMHRNLDDIPIEPRHSLQESFPSGFKSSKHAPLTTGTSPHASQNASRPTTPVLEERPRGRSTSIKPISTFVKADRQSPAASRKSVIKLTKILGLSADDPSADVIPSKETLMSYKMTKDDWEQLFSEIRSSWNPDHLPDVQNTLQRWNQTFFSEREAQIVLCEEFGVPWLKYAIYHFPWKDKLPTLKDLYDSIPKYLTRLDIYSLPSGADALSLSSSRLDIPNNSQPDRP